MMFVPSIASVARWYLLVTIAVLNCFALSRDARAQCASGCDFNQASTFYGYSALQVDSGKNDSAFGFQALGFFVSGDRNTAVGSGALSGTFDSNGEPTSTGSDNTAIGAQALHSDRAGSYNVASGSQALASNLDGNYNVANGFETLSRNTSGNDNTAVGGSALTFNQTGSFNTAVGLNALRSNSVDENTAVGANAMLSSTTGVQNAALGTEALAFNDTGSENTANGYRALYNNTSGSYNTGDGFQALYSNNGGGGNVADGWQAAYSNSSGQYNTASGVSALRQNTTGNNNTATGTNALYHTNGSNNVALGYAAGQNLTTGSNNIIIGANLLGASNDANITRIGKTTQAKTFIGGIYNKTVASGVGVIVNSRGQLGTIQSSARYKADIKPMDKTSEAILKLKPVTFRYKEELDPDKIPQFGLIAEEVEKINPDLVVRDEEGKVMTVRYDAVNAMLLNEFLKEHQTVEELRHTVAKQEQIITQQKSDFSAQIAQQKQQIETLAAGLQKMTATIELKKPFPHRVTAND